MVWCGSQDENPAALYLLLMYVVPPVNVPIPTVIINQLFDLSNLRLLALAILLPAAIRMRNNEATRSGRRIDSMDYMVLAYMTLVLLLFIPYESITNTLRRLFLYGLDTLLIYYVFSRVGPSITSLRDCMASWLLAGLLFAPVALFETGRMWLLYTGIPERWGDPNEYAWLFRGDLLRAQASTGHAIPLGYMLAMAWGFFLYVQKYWASKWPRYVLGALLIGGLWSTFSRGPWLTAALFTIIYLVLSPGGLAAAARTIAGLLMMLIIIIASPLGDEVLAYLPFVGNFDGGSVDYRKQLLQVSLQLIGQNPLFGSPDVLLQLESLRQGQGIIDLINGYIQIALFYGLVGLGLFVALLILGIRRGVSAWHRVRGSDFDSGRAMAALVAAMVSSMFFIATASYGHTTYILAGLLAGSWYITSHALDGAKESVKVKSPGRSKLS